MLLQVLFGCMVIAGLVQLALHIFAFRKLAALRNQTAGLNHRAQVPLYASRPVSVVICAHNEAGNLRAFLPKVLAQNYLGQHGATLFEVVVVNDCSDDETDSVLESFTAKYPQLRIVTIDKEEPRALPGKKFPLARGLAAAQYDWIVCTDADCAPATDVWLHFMAAPLLEGKEIVLGYGGYVLQRGIVNTFTRFETMHTFFQYGAFTAAGVPYMAVGRNLAATKAVFERAQQDPLWQQMPSGDDDLLIRICATRENVGLVAHPASFTWTSSKTNWRDYVQQKRRHVSTGKLYRSLPKVLLAAHALSIVAACFLPVLAAVTIPAPIWVRLTMLLFAIPPLLIPAMTFSDASLYLQARTRWYQWLWFFFGWTVYNVVLAPYILWKTKQRWK